MYHLIVNYYIHGIFFVIASYMLAINIVFEAHTFYTILSYNSQFSYHYYTLCFLVSTFSLNFEIHTKILKIFSRSFFYFIHFYFLFYFFFFLDLILKTGSISNIFSQVQQLNKLLSVFLCQLFLIFIHFLFSCCRSGSQTLNVMKESTYGLNFEEIGLNTLIRMDVFYQFFKQ